MTWRIPMRKFQPSRLFQKKVSESTYRSKKLNVNTRKKKPLVLILPWLGASSQAISKYSDLYKDAGMDVVVHNIQLKYFLWPKAGLVSSEKLLDELRNKMQKNPETEQPIIVHSFSIGCYFYALMIMQMKRNLTQYHPIWENISGVIIDSPVVGTLNEMAYGVSKMLSPNYSSLSSVLKNICLCYFAISRGLTVDIYEKSIHAIKNESPVTPMLVTACENDPMLVLKALNDTVEGWRGRGCDVVSKVWNVSGHAQHFRHHPEEYIHLVDELVSKALLNESAITSKL